MAMNRWWNSKLPYWILGSINLVCSGLVVILLLVGPHLPDSPYEFSFAVLLSALVLPGMPLLSVLYLLIYRKQSRLFSLVAWLTLAVFGGFMAFVVMGRGA